jgi:Aspartate amino-transferase
MRLSDLDPDQLATLHGEATTAYAELVAQGLTLDLTRGKPAPAQLDLSNALLTLPGEGQYRAADGTDCRNYGGGRGLLELREIFADLLNVPVAQLATTGTSRSASSTASRWCPSTSPTPVPTWTPYGSGWPPTRACAGCGSCRRTPTRPERSIPSR